MPGQRAASDPGVVLALSFGVLKCLVCLDHLHISFVVGGFLGVGEMGVDVRMELDQELLELHLDLLQRRMRQQLEHLVVVAIVGGGRGSP